MAQPIWVGIVSWSGWLPMSSHLPLTSWPLLKPNDAFSHPEIAAAHRHTAVALLSHDARAAIISPGTERPG